MWFLLALSLAFAHPLLLQEGYEHEKSILGGDVYNKVISDTLRSTYVELPDAQTFAETIQNLIANPPEPKVNRLQQQYLTCDPGDGPDFFRFFPHYIDSVYKDGPAKAWNNTCFETNSVQVTGYTDTTLTVTFDFGDRNHYLCYDSYVIMTVGLAHAHMADFGGKHEITFSGISALEWDDINFNGVRIFRMCDTIDNLIKDVLMTAEMFIGGFGLNPDIPIFGSHVMPWQEQASLEFLRKSVGYDLQEREVNLVDIDENLIHSGDYFGIVRLDGLSQIIMFGTGARDSHNTMALWIEENGTRELYVLESQGGWYWPVNGLQKTPWKEWLKLADNASHLIIWLPLRDDLRASFNETNVYEWFKTVEGTPYGYHNFLFGWIDTINDNYPSLLSTELFTCAIGLADRIIPKAIDSLYNQAMNKRLGTKGLNVNEIASECAKRNVTMGEVMTYIEVEGWEYSDGVSYVCCAFVAAMWKRGGVFGDMELQATEVGPQDTIMMDIFNTTSVRPQACVDADPDLPYCQIMGKYRVDIGDVWSTIKPYANMDEHCPSKAPFFERPAGC